MTVEAQSSLWNSFPLVCLCVCDGSGGGGEEKCYWGYYGDSISEHPPLHTYTQTHASLRLTHPDSLARTKKQIFLRGIPSVVEAASGFTNWSERGLGERVPRWGSLLTYASSQICWARKLHKTMLISGILSVLWGAGGWKSDWKSVEWKWGKLGKTATVRREDWVCASKCHILRVLYAPVKGERLACDFQAPPSQNVTLVDADLCFTLGSVWWNSALCFYLSFKQEGYFCPWISSHISAESAEVFIFPPKNRLAGNRGRMLVIPQTKDEHRGCSILTSNSLITAICFSLITLNRLGWMRSRKTSSPECVSLLEGCFYLIYTLSYWWNAADCDTSPPTHTLTDTLASSSA